MAPGFTLGLMVSEHVFGQLICLVGWGGLILLLIIVVFTTVLEGDRDGQTARGGHRPPLAWGEEQVRACAFALGHVRV